MKNKLALSNLNQLANKKNQVNPKQTVLIPLSNQSSNNSITAVMASILNKFTRKLNKLKTTRKGSISDKLWESSVLPIKNSNNIRNIISMIRIIIKNNLVRVLDNKVISNKN